MLHDFIAAHRSEILGDCLETLKGRYPDRADDELLDSMPSFVDELIDALRRDAAVLENGNEAGLPDDTSAKQHGESRKSQGFNLNRIVHDYGLVCEVVSSMASQYREVFSAREYQILNRCVDEAIASAINSFEEMRTAEEKDMTTHLGFVFHEIRNAIGNASLGFELIRRGKAGTDGRTADAVNRALGRIANLVAESLAEARLKGIVARPERMRLADLFGRLAADTYAQASIRIEIQVPDDLYMDVDERLLASALHNLLQNGLKFSPADETIIFRAFVRDGAIAIEVEDRCGGLPEGGTEHLFEAFVQGSNDRRGTGLGLAIARRAVEAHGGHITVRNLPGLGCIFAISLPQTTRVVN